MTGEQLTIEVTEGGIELPVEDVLTGRGAVFGKSGSGKSNTVGVIAEQLLEQNFPLLIIDKDGEHYGLKEEYQLLHVGADDSADVIVGPEHAETLATLALDENVPIILDVSGFLDGDVTDALVRDTVSALFRMEKKRKVPFPIIIEEAHEFIPETNHPDETATALIKAAKRGRKHGLGITAVSQRPANVNKDLVTQADWVVWHKLTWGNDTQVVRKVLTPEHAQAVQDLDVGEGLLDADWMDDVRSVKFKRKRTFDAGKTPGLDDFERPELQPVDEEVMATLSQIEDEDDEEDRVAHLKSERDRLESKVTELQQRLDDEDEPSPDVVELRERNEELEAKNAEIEADLEKLESDLEQRDEQITSLREEIDDLEWARRAVQQAREALGSSEGDGDARIAELEKQIERLEKQNEELRNADGPVATIPAAYEDFYEHEIVDEAIEAVADESEASQRAVWGVILTIADVGGPAEYDEVADRLGYADNSQISRAASALEDRKVIEQVDTNPKRIDFNFDGMEEIERLTYKRDEMENRIEQQVNDD